MEDGLVLAIRQVALGAAAVLILVVMEDGLVRRACSKWRSSNLVLILVVMEDGLVLVIVLSFQLMQLCLNPCCNGRWSRT